MIIEGAVIRFLSDALATEHVYAERPANVPDEYYIIEKTGGGEANHIQSAMIAVQSISSGSLLRAAEMDLDVRKAMPMLVQEDEISHCSLNSSYNFTNDETREYRYQSVFDISYTEGE